MKKLSTFDDVLALWETPKALSEALGVPYINAQAIKARGSIGVGHWPKMIELLRSRGYSVSTDDLAVMWQKASEARRASKADPIPSQGRAA
jgi:hypothetical protein